MRGTRVLREFVRVGRGVAVPLLAVSSMPKLLQQQASDLAVVPRSITRDELVVTIDRLLIDRSVRDAASSTTRKRLSS